VCVGVESDSTEDIKERVETWNVLLGSQAEEFAKDSKRATLFVFATSRLALISLKPEMGGAGIWTDDLHLMPAVHAIFAERLLGSLIKP